MGCGESAVMDLEPIEERANEFATWVGKFDSTQRIPAAFASAADVPALVEEVKRLRAEVARLRAATSPAWDEGVAVALNHAIRNEDGITLRLEHLDGRPWVNPYREGGADRG